MTHEEGANPSQAASSSAPAAWERKKAPRPSVVRARRPRPRYQQLTSMLSPDAAVVNRAAEEAAEDGCGVRRWLTSPRSDSGAGGRPEIKMKATP